MRLSKASTSFKVGSLTPGFFSLYAKVNYIINNNNNNNKKRNSQTLLIDSLTRSLTLFKMIKNTMYSTLNIRRLCGTTLNCRIKRFFLKLFKEKEKH